MMSPRRSVDRPVDCSLIACIATGFLSHVSQAYAADAPPAVPAAIYHLEGRMPEPGRTLLADASPPTAAPPTQPAPTGSTPFTGEKTAWHDGFDRYDYVMDEATHAITPFKRDQDEGFGVKAPAKGQR